MTQVMRFCNVHPGNTMASADIITATFSEYTTPTGEVNVLVTIRFLTPIIRSPGQDLAFMSIISFGNGESYPFHLHILADESDGWLQCERYGEELVKMRAAPVEDECTLVFSGSLS